MKSTIIQLIFLFVISVVTAQNPKRDLNQLALKGPVKELEVRTYLAVDNFGKPGKGDRVNDNASYIFNAAGNQLEQNIYNKNGSLRVRCAYLYNSNGKLHEQNQYNLGGALRSKFKYQYNGKGGLNEQSIFKPDGSLVSKYNYVYDYHRNQVTYSY